jgi:hypothetical protein
MPVVIDKPVHRLRIECDGKPTPLYCAVMIERLRDTRDACNEEIYAAGWRLDGERTLCPACLKRERGN